jgi:hypothetical protein
MHKNEKKKRKNRIKTILSYLQRDVFPVPGGPWSRTTRFHAMREGLTSFLAKNIAEHE